MYIYVYRNVHLYTYVDISECYICIYYLRLVILNENQIWAKVKIFFLFIQHV